MSQHNKTLVLIRHSKWFTIIPVVFGHEFNKHMEEKLKRQPWSCFASNRNVLIKGINEVCSNIDSVVTAKVYAQMVTLSFKSEGLHGSKFSQTWFGIHFRPNAIVYILCFTWILVFISQNSLISLFNFVIKVKHMSHHITLLTKTIFSTISCFSYRRKPLFHPKFSFWITN